MTGEDKTCPHTERIQYQVEVTKLGLGNQVFHSQFILCQGCLSDLLDKGFQLVGFDPLQDLKDYNPVADK